MIINQPTSLNTRRQFAPDPLSSPIYWVENDSISPLRVAETISLYQRIPKVIRDTLEQPFVQSGVRNQFKIFIGTGQFLIYQYAQGYGSNPGDVVWAGLYLSYGRGTSYTTAINYQGAIVHEFGHHVDFTYNRLWPGASGLMTRITQEAAVLSLWNAAYPTIPTGQYGRTNEREWFAELWEAQVYDANGDIDTFKALCGNNPALYAPIRAMFTSRMPMPTKSGFNF